jgi:hypothetical protein
MGPETLTAENGFIPACARASPKFEVPPSGVSVIYNNLVIQFEQFNFIKYEKLYPNLHS